MTSRGSVPVHIRVTLGVVAGYGVAVLIIGLPILLEGHALAAAGVALIGLALIAFAADPRTHDWSRGPVG